MQQIVASGIGARGASSLCRPEFWDEALQLFIRAGRILVITGFYIQRAEASETDGPPGAVALGRALARVGKEVILLTDSRNYKSLSACSHSVSGPSVAKADDPLDVQMDMDLLVFIERPGHATDDRYYDMKGTDIGDVVVPLDKIAKSALRRGIPVLGIGDGGNEAGMGIFYDALVKLLPRYAPCLSRVPATVCLPVDISNWGAYALTAVLSGFYRCWLGMDEGEESIMLEALSRAGAVDGVTGLPSASVDGVPLEGPGGLEETEFRLRSWYSGSFEV
ncbi:MAG: DUF4392 domain-containing protein [Synergistaceae bacterium]|nr:DUF4392 domain-containing protein [Synergistaceae bacterium]